MTAPYREPEMPRHAKRVRWREIAKWTFVALALAVAAFLVREGCLYLKAHPSPEPPTEEDERKGAEREAIRALRQIFPDRDISVHCTYRDYEISGCTERRLFSCISFIQDQEVSCICKSGLHPEAYGCSKFEFATMTHAPAGTP